MAKQVKIGFVQASNEVDVQWFEPLSFGYLKAYLDKYLDDKADMRSLNTLEDIEHYDIIGISSTSQDFWIAKDIAASIKKCNRDIIVILGGHHITYLPETLSGEFDIGVIGEGEATFAELIEYFVVSGLRLKPESLKNINGIVYRDNGHIIITKPRELITPLDTIPLPYRTRGVAPYLFTSRGCPYKCAFCSSTAFWCNTRFFSAEYVVNEIEHLIKESPKLNNITIWDDLFIANKPRFKRTVELIEQKALNKKISFSFSVRANLVDDDLCNDLKRLGVTATSFGAESGSDRILRVLNKGTTVQINQKALDTLQKHNIQAICSFIVGSPTETEHDVRSTYEFILKNIIDGKLNAGCAINILMPMPGTTIWDYAVKSNIIDVRNFDWKRLSVFASYRHSKANDFNDWLDYRRNNNSIYLAEETLPQERLYEIMYIYESCIQRLENNDISSTSMPDNTLKSTSMKITALFRKTLKLISN